MEEEKKGFVVKDRRRFGEDGEKKDEAEVKKEAEPTATATEDVTGREQAEPDYLPEVNFYNFVVSLSTSALFHFGDFVEEGGQKPEKNLPAVKQIIDTLAMLQIKTQGNLDDDEKRLMEGILYELRMRYVKESS